MITLAFLAFAGYLFFGNDLTEKAKAWLAAHPIDPRHAAAVALLLAAVVSYAYRPAAPDVAPPAPAPDTFTLRGLFIGPDAATDAAMLSAMCDELADCIEHDGTHDLRLKTGVQFDELRIAARDARMKGESLGDRQPKVRDAVHKFLDQAVGTSGGPVTTESRAAWVTAFRDLAAAAGDAAK